MFFYWSLGHVCWHSRHTELNCPLFWQLRQKRQNQNWNWTITLFLWIWKVYVQTWKSLKNPYWSYYSLMSIDNSLRILYWLMLLLRKPLFAVSDRWKLPLLHGISYYSYICPLDRATNTNKTITNCRKKTIYFPFVRADFPCQSSFPSLVSNCYMTLLSEVSQPHFSFPVFFLFFFWPTDLKLRGV